MTLDEAIAKAKDRPSWEPGKFERSADVKKKRDGSLSPDDFTFLLRWPREDGRPLWVSASGLRDAWQRDEPRLHITTVRRRMEKCRDRTVGYVRRRKNAHRNGQKNRPEYMYNLTKKGVGYCKEYKSREGWKRGLSRESHPSASHQT